MRQVYLTFSVLLLYMVMGQNVWGTEIKYVVKSATEVSATGTAPDGSSAELSSTGSLYSGTIRMTSGQTSILTLSGYTGYKITGIALSVRSNTQGGSGSFTALAGSTTIASIPVSTFNSSDWNGAWSTNLVSKIVTISNNTYTIGTNENVVLTLNSSENSLYICSWTITYEKANTGGNSQTATVSSIALNGSYKTQFVVNNDFIHDGASVIATYSDNTTVDVTSRSVFSTPDMTTDGDKTVTVSYTESGKTVSTSYMINVSNDLIVPAAGYEMIDFTKMFAITVGYANLKADCATSFRMETSNGTNSSNNYPKYYVSDISVHAYKGNIITITGVDNIKGVFIQFSKGTTNNVIYTIESKIATIKFNETCYFTSITIYYKDQTITRSTSTGKYGTICVPTPFTASGAILYSASLNTEKNSVVLTEITTPVAGTPYIYQATADAQTFTYASGAIVFTPSSAAPLVGTFEEVKVPVGSYIMQTQSGVQQFYKVADGARPTLSANKAYLDGTKVSGAKTLNIGFADENISAINAVNAIVEGSATIYDLYGRRLSSLKKGLNIVNGVKVLVK